MEQGGSHVDQSLPRSNLHEIDWVGKMLIYGLQSYAPASTFPVRGARPVDSSNSNGRIRLKHLVTRNKCIYTRLCLHNRRALAISQPLGLFSLARNVAMQADDSVREVVARMRSADPTMAL